MKRSLTAQIALIDKDSGGISQVSLKPDWSQPSREFPMFAQQAALSAYARAAVLFGDPAYRAAADRIFGFLKNTLAAPDGGFYASMGMAEGQPGVDKRQYARETGSGDPGHAGLLRFDRRARRAGAGRRGCRLGLARASAAGRRLSPCRARYRRPLPRRQCRDGAGAPGAASLDGRAQMAGRGRATGDYIARTFVDPRDRRLLRLGLARCQALPKPIKQREDNVTATRFFTLLAAYTGRRRYREIAEAGMGYLASPAVLDAYGFLPDVLQAEENCERARARDGRRRQGRSAPAALCAARWPIRWPTSAPNGGTREGPLSTPTSTIPIFPTARRPSPARATSARCPSPISPPFPSSSTSCSARNRQRR